jgi:hypothetical protein
MIITGNPVHLRMIIRQFLLIRVYATNAGRQTVTREHGKMLMMSDAPGLA